MKPHCLSGFVDCESRLAAHDVVPGEVLRNCGAVHTILLSQVSDAESGEVIIDQTIHF